MPVWIILCIILLFAVLVYFLNIQVIAYTPAAGPLVNPLMGWAPWATIEKSFQPHMLVYADLTWRDLEPAEGVFDFTAFEASNQLDRWRSEGQRVVFRFIADKPGDTAHMDIPDWLYEKMDGSGDFYDNEYGQGFSPDYSHPAFLEYHQKAIRVLGERYGRDGFFAFIELGSLGHWGEWHVYYSGEIRRLPAEDIRDLYVSHYLQAFPGTHLLMRRPFNIASRENLGLYNDMTADVEATGEWLGWIATGGDFNQTGEKAALTAMPDGWQTAPIGGEQTQSMREEDIYSSDLGKTISLLRASHATFIGPGCPYDHPAGGNLQEGIDQVLANLGYRLYIRKVRMPKVVLFGNSIPLTVIFSNDGIAPFYYDWPVMAYLLSRDGQILASQLVDMDIRKVLPGSSLETRFRLPLDGLDNGTVAVGLAILDPLTNQPAVRLAMDCASNEDICILGEFDLKRFGK